MEFYLFLNAVYKNREFHMKITYIRLENFARMPFHESDVFECHFTAKLIMILGGNGHGKSQLISELTPLPASKESFKKNGYKEIHIEFNKSQYVLISDFREGSIFHFIKDGEELNKAGLVSAQRDLVYDCFKISPIVHELLTSQEEFTSMSLIARKKLLNAISHMNIDAVLDNYNELKETHKNHQFLLKSTASQLVTESQKLNDEARVKTLTEQREKLVTQIDQLLAMRASLYQYSGTVNLDASIRNYTETRLAIDQLFQKHYCLLTSHPYKGLPEYIEGLRSEAKACEALLSDKYARYTDFEYHRKLAESVQSTDIDQIQTKMRDAQAKYSLISSRLVYFTPDQERIETVIADLETIQSNLPEIVETLSPNPDKKFSQTVYQTLVERKNSATSEIMEIMKLTPALLAEEKELKAHKSLNCPNCNHSWIPADIDVRLKQINEELSVHLTKQARITEDVVQLNKLIEAQSAYLAQHAKLNDLYRHTNIHASAFWKHVMSEKIHLEQPRKLLTAVSDVINHARTVQELTALKAVITNYGKDLASAAQLGDMTLSKLNDQIFKLNEEISDAQSQLKDYNFQLQDATFARQLYDRFVGLYKALEDRRNHIQSQSLSHGVNAVMGEIDSQLSMLKVSVIEIEKELSQTAATKAIVENLIDKVSDTTESIRVLEIMLEELSPKNGFIAKTISNFLNIVITSINAVIRENWSYKMELKAINVDEDALNYRFKVVVEDKHIIDDISKVSGGMKEIVNLAVKFMLRILLKFQGYPMFLDELGTKLDAVHRTKISSIIFQMLNSPMYSQIFLITHLDIAFTEFRDTQVIEL